MAGDVRHIRAAERTADTAQTPGMRREQAVATDRFWTGTATTAPGMVSGWHHHGEHDTYFYVAAGRALLEFGPGGRDKVDAGPGDFAHVPRRTVHRESNPGEETSVIVVFRVGSGEVVVNVESAAS